MAKGKRAVALFEVIHKDKRFERKNAEPSPVQAEIAPLPAEIPASKPVAASPELAEQAVELWRKRHTDPETWKFPKPNFSAAKIGKSIAEQAQKWTARSRDIAGRAAKIAENARLWVLRQNSVACGAVAALVVIGALSTARHFYHASPEAKPIEQVLRDGPAHPAVLSVSNDTPPAAGDAALSPEMQADVQQADAKIAPAPAVANLAQPGERVVNMHYVLMQSYFEEKTADEARDFLIANGIACTIERGVKGWRPDFYQVIGLQGFTRASGEEYLAYRRRIEELGVQFSKSRYKRFQPEAIKW